MSAAVKATLVALVAPVVVVCGLGVLLVAAWEQANASCAAGDPGRWDGDQVANAVTIVRVGADLGVPYRGWVVAVATAMQESSLRNLGFLGDANDHDSLGLFQQRPSQGWGTPAQLTDPVYAATAFYRKLLAVPGWEHLPVTVAAQRVQISAFPDAYAKWESPATGLVADAATQLGLSDGCAAGGWVAPLATGSYTLTSGFGSRWGVFHYGLDFAAPAGTPILAAAAGTVVAAECTSPFCDRPGDVSATGMPLTPGCDPLTAPSGQKALVNAGVPAAFWVVLPVKVIDKFGRAVVVTGLSVRDELREGLVGLPAVGAVIEGDQPSLPHVLVDAAGVEVEPVSRFLRDLALSDRSPLTCRSYAMDLLRWWRMLAVLAVSWDGATTDEVAVLVGWLRHAPNSQRRSAPGSVNMKTGKPMLGAGYAPSTINHALSVLSGFYAFHAHYGRGPVVNPVPAQALRRALLAHRSPIEPQRQAPRAPLRQRTTVHSPRAIPDRLWDELFDAMTCVRDKALLAFYVSSGARASELLGLRAEHIDWAGQRIWVMTKGIRALEPVPASPLAFTLLALYFDQQGRPGPGEPVWRTQRGASRPLTYWAARRVLQRANAKLGTNWTLHDTRHTAATRMANDPDLTLPEVQTVMRHAHLATTQRYLGVDLEELFSKLHNHYQRPVRDEAAFPAGYAAADVATVFGG